MQTEIFIDTAGWGHLIDQTQQYHSQAAFIYRSARQEKRKFITTNYVVAEIVALLTSPMRISRSAVIAFIESLKASPHVKIVHINKTLDQQAWQLLVQHQDKNWSLVDCSSFVIMRQRSIFEALTTDHHFEQAGFLCLLV
jgi:predicted nucleic acid-binding protein